ncbi:hypothetical protein [Deminuibacter soli]|uniref:YcxB family protein n=1 Tax=Deminuibacter soli TaxID=2291815 RepID=A0A3E1NJ80_9BACT|nr:hypothetical protein [Deminuibacter soli]RFM27982.1 hypothetical protein DXN05_10585 [Deminuibacter soli]
MTEQYDYVITLKKKDRSGIDLIGFLLYILGFLFFLRFFAITRNLLDVLFAVIVLVFFIAKIRHKKIRQRFFLRGGLLIIAVGILSMHRDFWYLGVFYLLAAFLESYAKTPLEIGFSKDNVTVNSIPRKHFTWNSIGNAVLKDELLTIDFKNNKLIQQHTEPYGKDMEQEFNDFCRTSIQGSR